MTQVMRVVDATDKLEGIRLKVSDTCIKPNFAQGEKSLVLLEKTSLIGLAKADSHLGSGNYWR
jgi:hypothetical protein